jgi:hypothetical protein
MRADEFAERRDRIPEQRQIEVMMSSLNHPMRCEPYGSIALKVVNRTAKKRSILTHMLRASRNAQLEVID